MAVCDGIKAALQDERERWQSAVMLELDSNGQAHAIVAAALGPNAELTRACVGSNDR